MITRKELLKIIFVVFVLVVGVAGHFALGLITSSAAVQTIIMQPIQPPIRRPIQPIQPIIPPTQPTEPATNNDLPIPPSYAKVFSNIDDMAGWGSCGAKGCASGQSNASIFTILQNVSDPSLEGKSAEITLTGPAYANALWWKKLGANNTASHFLWDSYFYADDSIASKAVGASEFDTWQSIGGYNYMIGSQCNYNSKVWDIWNQVENKWVPTSIPCSNFSVGWHHIQWYTERIPGSHEYKYVTLVVDGIPYTLNIVEPASYNGWGDNLGVQYQLDLSKSGGTVREWIDKENLTIW